MFSFFLIKLYSSYFRCSEFKRWCIYEDYYVQFTLKETQFCFQSITIIVFKTTCQFLETKFKEVDLDVEVNSLKLIQHDHMTFKCLCLNKNLKDTK